MPILNLQLVGDQHDYPDDLASRVAQAAGSVLQSRPHGTWVSLAFIPANHYAENTSTEGRDANPVSKPLIVSLLEADPPAGHNLQQQVSALTQAIAEAANHPAENVHIIVEPAGRGRIAFGGTLVD